MKTIDGTFIHTDRDGDSLVIEPVKRIGYVFFSVECKSDDSANFVLLTRVQLRQVIEDLQEVYRGLQSKPNNNPQAGESPRSAAEGRRKGGLALDLRGGPEASVQDHGVPPYSESQTDGTSEASYDRGPVHDSSREGSGSSGSENFGGFDLAYPDIKPDR